MKGVKSHLPLRHELHPDLTPVFDIVETGEVIYALQPKQLEFFEQTPVGAPEGADTPEWFGYGGAAGGGKSHVTRALATAVAMRWPGSTSIIFRRTEREVMENHVNKFRKEVPERLADGRRLYSWNGEEMCVIWYNGSRTYFGYLRLDEDVFRYQGPEYDAMFFEEATHYSWFMVQYLTGNRLRATVPESRPFVVCPSNPGGRGHAWYKRLFIERNYHVDDGEVAADYYFLQARLADNRILRERDPKYEKRLNRLPEPYRSWQRDGDWEAGAGGAFPELDEHVHFVKPFRIPDHWVQFGAFDWGFAHPFSFGHYCIDEDGAVIKIQTVWGIRLQPHDIADRICAMVPVAKLKYISGGHDLWSKVRARGDQGESLWEYFAGRGIVCVHADTDRIQGFQNMIRYTAWKTVDGGKAGEPRFRLFDTPGNRFCYNQLATMTTIDGGGEDVLKVDADERGDGGDDCYDETRYGLMSVRMKGESDDNPPLPRGGAFSPENLAHMAHVSRLVTDEEVEDEKDFHPEFGRFY